MIERDLEILIITFNRSQYLNNTLNQLLKSPFNNCKISILDNGSTDDTPNICKKFQKKFNKLNIIRNKVNIGFGANYLRAIESSESTYTWILADNDELDFTKSEDAIKAITSKKYDMIVVYSPPPFNNLKYKSISKKLNEANPSKNYCETSGKKLLQLIEDDYFACIGFISSTIFKTDLYTSETIIEGYINIYNLFPHISLILNSIEKDYSIYKTKYDIIKLQPNPEEKKVDSWTPLSYYAKTLDLFSKIKDKTTQQKLTKKFRGKSYLYLISLSLITSMALQEDNRKNDMIQLLTALIKLKGFFIGLIYTIYILMLYSIPNKIYVKLYQIYDVKVIQKGNNKFKL